MRALRRQSVTLASAALVVALVAFAVPSCLYGPCGPDNSITLVDHGIVLRGRVLDGAGAPVREAWVYASPGGWSNAKVVSCYTTPDGTFELGPLRRGECAVLASGRGGRAKAIVDAGTTDLVLTLRPEARVEGVVRPPADHPGALASIMRSTKLEDRSSGSESIASHAGAFGANVDAGANVFFATDSAGHVSQPLVLDLAPGERRTGVELQLERAARLRVRYRGEFVRARCGVNRDGFEIENEDVDPSSKNTSIFVPAGELTVELRRWTGDRLDPDELPRQTQTVRVAAGETTTLVFKD